MGCKLLIEVPVNGGRNYNGPKVDLLPPALATMRCASGYMLGKLSPKRGVESHTTFPITNTCSII